MKTQDFEALFSNAKHLHKEGKIITAIDVLQQSIHRAKNAEEFGKGFEYLGKLLQSDNADKALDYYLKSLNSFKESDNIEGLISVLNRIALLYAQKRDYQKSIEYYENCLKNIRKINDITKEMAVLKNLGKLFNISKEHVKSLRCHQRSLEIARKSENVLEEARKLKHLGFTYEDSGNYEIARDYYNQSLNIYEQIKYKKGIERLTKLLDNLAEIEEKFEEEEYLFEKFDLKYDQEDFF